MADEKNSVTPEEKTASPAAAPAKAKKAAKNTTAKKGNFFQRIGNFFRNTWRKIVKLCKDTSGEMKKVVWTPKDEVRKSTFLVIVTVVAVGVAIGVVDFACSKLINFVAGLIG